jgi:hypothetical protein
MHWMRKHRRALSGWKNRREERIRGGYWSFLQCGSILHHRHCDANSQAQSFQSPCAVDQYPGAVWSDRAAGCGWFFWSLYGGAGFAASTDKVENGTATFAQLIGGIPFSFDVTETNTLVIQPLYSHDFYKVKISDDTVYDDRFDAHLIHLGFGVIRKNLDKDRAVFYNVTMNYSPANKQAYLTFGVAIML